MSAATTTLTIIALIKDQHLARIPAGLATIVRVVGLLPRWTCERADPLLLVRDFLRREFAEREYPVAFDVEEVLMVSAVALGMGDASRVPHHVLKLIDRKAHLLAQ